MHGAGCLGSMMSFLYGTQPNNAYKAVWPFSFDPNIVIRALYVMLPVPLPAGAQGRTLARALSTFGTGGAFDIGSLVGGVVFQVLRDERWLWSCDFYFILALLSTIKAAELWTTHPPATSPSRNHDYTFCFPHLSRARSLRPIRCYGADALYGIDALDCANAIICCVRTRGHACGSFRKRRPQRAAVEPGHRH